MVVMEPSILKSTKKTLGLLEDETPFDLDVLTYINTAFSTVQQIGIGPSHGYSVEDDTTVWADLNLPIEMVALLKAYISLKVRMLFDPPATSFHIDALERASDELFQRLSYLREAYLSEEDDESFTSGESASGTQSTPASIWIMNHSLGFNPAGFRFTSLDGSDELEPESITYVSINTTLAIWPDPIAGNWVVS